MGGDLSVSWYKFTNCPHFSYLCHASTICPTMETVKDIGDQLAVDMAMNSILYEIFRHNRKCSKLKSTTAVYINTIVIPYLGTGLTYQESAKQMSSAYLFFNNQYPD